MFSFGHCVILPPDTQVRVDSFIGRIDTYLAPFNTTTNTLSTAITPDTIASFDHTLRGIANWLRPSTITAFVTAFESIAQTFDRAVTEDTPKHIENTLVEIEGILGNVNAITRHIRNFTSVFAALIVGLGISLLIIRIALLSTEEEPYHRSAEGEEEGGEEG
jgi:hypothetical protein